MSCLSECLAATGSGLLQSGVDRRGEGGEAEGAEWAERAMDGSVWPALEEEAMDGGDVMCC